MSIAAESEPTEPLEQASGFDRQIKSAPGRPRLLIVGGGMAAFGLCDRLVRSGTISKYQVSAFGEEPTVAYDRVNLSKLFNGRSAAQLQLAGQEWYEQCGIDFRTNVRIREIDRNAREIVDQHDRRHRYEQLVLATGSRPRLPSIPGADSPGVFVYRTLADLKGIQQFVRSRRARVGAVLGGGLLGLEAAKVLQDLQLKTSVIEMAPGLMPRQLDANAASLLKKRIESIGVDVHLIRRTSSIVSNLDGRLTLTFENADPMVVDLLIIAAGVIPNDDLGRQCGLDVAARGGIVVDERLRTSDPSIFAIGECVSFRNHVYGLVAPCYRMADVLANRLGGNSEAFVGADESAELKLIGVRVAALGQAIGDSPTGIPLTQSNDDSYRKLILSQGRIVGAACVGEWDELPRIRQAVQTQRRLWPWQRSRFRRTGSPWIPGGAISVADWPSNSIVCACHGVTRGQLGDLVADGVADPDLLAESSGASTACGSCRSLVCQLAGHRDDHIQLPATNILLIASLAGVVLVAAWLFVPSIPFAQSVQSPWRSIDVLWRSDVARQVTGFTLLGLLVLALVFSFRKRANWFRLGSYRLWRSIHGVLGTCLLVAVGVHTGFRLGENLNLFLSLSLIGTAALGTLAGVVSSLEGRFHGSPAMLLRAWRPWLTRVHLWLFWPVPVLIALHIFSFYWFDD